VYSTVVRCRGTEAWLAIEATAETEWPAIWRAIGKPEIAEDPRHQTGSDRRGRGAELRDCLENWAAGRTSYRAFLTLQRGGVRCGVVQSAEDFLRDPQLWATGFIRQIRHADLGTVNYPSPSIHTHGHEISIKGPTPRSLRYPLGDGPGLIQPDRGEDGLEWRRRVPVSDRVPHKRFAQSHKAIVESMGPLAEAADGRLLREILADESFQAFKTARDGAFKEPWLTE